MGNIPEIGVKGKSEKEFLGTVRFGRIFALAIETASPANGSLRIVKFVAGHSNWKWHARME